MFQPGDAIVYIPTWAQEKFKGGTTYKNETTGKESPLKYEDVVHFLAYHKPAHGHCIVTTYDGKVLTMLHPEDFRLATEDEV